VLQGESWFTTVEALPGYPNIPGSLNSLGVEGEPLSCRMDAMNCLKRRCATILLLSLVQVATVSTAFATAPEAYKRGLQYDKGSIKVRLALDRRTLRRGGSLRLRLINLGFQDVSYGYSYELSHLQYGVWTRLQTSPVFGPSLNLRTESVGPWQHIKISRHAAHGWYRVRKWVDPIPEGAGDRIPLTRTFQVVKR